MQPTSPSTLILPLLLVLIARTNLALTTINPDLVVKSCDRTLDLTTQITKLTAKLVLENTGQSPITSFVFALGEPHRHISHVSASLVGHNRPDLTVAALAESNKNEQKNKDEKNLYTIQLTNPLQPKRTVNVEVRAMLTNQLTPYPKEIQQRDKQLVRYATNLYLYSPYEVLKQTTKVLMPTPNIESYSKQQQQPVAYDRVDNSVKYGPYERKQPWSYEELKVHFENNNKMLVVRRLERAIEVSHWGNVAVEEKVEMEHTGALLKGSFSRYEYARESKSGQSSIPSFDTVLPAAASDIYYRDEIGNISTSHTRVKSDSVEINLRPRFPLFGGWKTKYTLGYNVPSYEYLYNSGDRYVLNMRLLDHIFDDMVVDELVVKIILPEGSHDIQLELPYEATRLPGSLHYTYLDTVGRPVVAITKRNLVENHIQNFQLRYAFPKYLMLQEPLLVTVALYLLFLLVVIYVRLDFSIDKDEASESKLRVAGQCAKILSAHDRRVASYKELDDQLTLLKTSKDVPACLAALKGVNVEYKNATAAVAELALKIKGESSDVYERVQDLQKFDRKLKELFNQQQSLYVDKLIPGKIGRQQFIEAESAINKVKEECIEKINNIVKSLQ